MSKYFPLCNYLSKCEYEHIQLSFTEIEHILGFSLPKSAYTYPEWWANGGHKHAGSWNDAGYKTEQLNLTSKTVIFQRQTK